MKLTKKLLSIVLCVLMVFSTVSVAAFAEDETAEPDYTYTMKYYANKSDEYGIGKLLDELNKFLAEQNIHEVIEITKGVSFDIDLRSVNALCGTLDEFQDLLDNLLISTAIKIALGDLEYVSFKTWETGLKRSPVNDVVILKELIEFINANGTVINKVVDGSLDLGLANKFIDLKKLLGDDGISGALKRAIFGIVYSKDEVNNGIYTQYKDNVDAFVYGPLLEKIVGEYLEGYSFTADTNVEDLICVVFNGLFAGKISELIKQVYVNLYTSDIEAVRLLAPHINLNGSTYDLSCIRLDANRSIASQFNDIVGDIVAQIIPGCGSEWEWVDGDYTNINENIANAIRYLGKKTGLIADADNLDYDQLMVKLMELVISSVKLDNLEDGVANCKTIEDAFRVILINAARDMGITYEYKDTDSYLVPLGDLLAVWAYDNFDIRDNNNKAYRGCCGDDVWTVSNYLLNYFLFTEGFAGYLGVDVKKTDSLFTKLDKLFDLLGSSKDNGKSFDSEKFFAGKNGEKGLFDSILTLDIENLVKITAISALNFAGNTKAVEFIYNTLRYALNNWNTSSKELVPAYVNGSAFTNLLSNENIGILVKGFLSTLNSKKDNATVIISFLCSLLIKDAAIDLGAPAIKVNDCNYTGKTVAPVNKVVLNGKTLVENVDYILTPSSMEIGPAKANIKLIGIYKGEASADFNINLASVSKITVASASTSAIKITWKAVPGADEYKIYSGSTLVGTVEAGKTLAYTFKNLKSATKYTFKVKAVSDENSSSKAAAVTCLTLPTKVTKVKISSITGDSMKLSWNAVDGATGYIVERYDAAKKTYVRAGKTSSLSLTVTGLDSYTKYRFRVKAYKTDSTTVYGDYSDSVSATTKLGKVTGLKVAKRTADSIKLTWSKVNNAKGYTVEQYINGKWVKLKNVTGLYCTATKLKPSTNYAFRVRAYISSSVYGKYSDTFKAYSGVKAITGVKTSSVKETSVKVSWKASSDASKYVVYKSTNGKTWTKVDTTAKTALTVKGLETGTKYYFKVLGYNSKSKLYSEEFSKVSATTLVGKVDSLKATSRKKTSITLSWAAEAGANGYIVYTSTDGKKWTKSGTVSATTFTVSGLKANTNYQFKVRAYQKISSGKYYGTYSNVLKARTRLF